MSRDLILNYFSKKFKRLNVLFTSVLRIRRIAQLYIRLAEEEGIQPSVALADSRQFSGLVGYQVAHPFRMERRERVERSNAGFAIQPLTVCCCGAL